jgi:uncharacterized membrane protein (DUF373 family)
MGFQIIPWKKVPGRRQKTGRFFLLDSHWHALVVRAVAGTMMVVLYLWIIAGIVDLFLQLSPCLAGGWHGAAEQMITHTVTLLATFELIRTLQSYLKIGRVRVTFILDAALVVLIGELIALWYGEYKLPDVVTSLVVIVLLTLLRIITSRFSPGVTNP